MRTRTILTSLFLGALASVYSGRAALGNAEGGVIAAVDNGAGPVVSPLDPTTGERATPTSKPSNEGTSVSAPVVNVNDAGTIELHFNNVDLVEVLRMVALQTHKNIVASKEVHGTVSANLYGVTLHEALDAILAANGFAYKEKGNFIYVYTVKELQDLEKANRVTSTEVFHLNYTTAASAAAMIKPVLSAEAVTAVTLPTPVGLTTGAADIGGDSHAIEDMLVVTDYPDHLDKVRKIIKELDRRPQQILIEATILQATLTENNTLGINFTVLGGVDFQTLTGIGQTPASALNGSILNAGASSGGSSGGSGGSGGTGSTGSVGPVLDKGFNGVGTNFSPVLTDGMKIGYVNNNIAVFIQALESVTNTTTLANPKILALNKQKGEVIVGRKDGYLTTTVTQTSTVQTVDFLDTGTHLIFRPFIAEDGYIRMEVHPEDSSGGLTSANLPFKVTTEVTSNVMIKDGHTIVIGGLFREASTVSKGQVPFLGNLPLAGPLFRQQTDSTTRNEIIILLTPHIIKDDVAFSKESQELMKDSERLRVGVRQGMMPWGRERLAESSYNCAMAELAKPNPDQKKVLWHLDCATNLNPTFLEAITLKEKISGMALTSVDNSATRSFLRRMILVDVMAKATEPPATQPVAAAPATQPVAIAPATQPVAALDDDEDFTDDEAEVAAPTTQPVAIAPATQPVAAFDDDEDFTDEDAEVVVPAAAPATQPVVQTATTDGQDPDEEDEEVITQDTKPAAAPSPTTQPAQKPESPGTTITELPTDEVAPVDVPPEDQEKK